jgi:hypothetical protein
MPEEQMTKKERESLQKSLRTQTTGYIIGAFGLIAGLAWNDAVKSLIEYWVPLSGNTMMLKFVYAVIITLLVVFVSNYLTRIAAEE